MFIFATYKYTCGQIINPEITRSQYVRHFRTWETWSQVKGVN